MDEPSEPAPLYRTRLDVLFAAGAPRAVILRRGPKRHYRLIAWDHATDSFTCGQWMKGLVRLCDLSPDGQTLIYWAAQYHASARRHSGPSSGGPFDPLEAGTASAARSLLRRGRKVPRYLRAGIAPGVQANTGTWTAISTVPYFTALAIWPAFGHWTGGGFFAGGSRIVLFEPESRMVPVAAVPIPARMHILSVATLPQGGAGTTRSAHGPLYALNAGTRVRYPPDVRARYDALEKALRQGGLRTIEWVHEVGGDVLFGADGAVYRVPAGADLDPRAYAGSACQLMDSSDMTFELMRAPAEAMRWQV